MCRNHRGFVDATLALSKLGANALYLNTAFSGPQLAGVMEREEPVALIYDEEFGELLGEAEADELTPKRFVAWTEGGASGDTTLEELIEAGERPAASSRPRSRAASSSSPRARPGRRRAPSAPRPTRSAPLAAMFSRIPLHAREKTVIAAPLFHSWGFAHFQLGPGAATRPTCCGASSTPRRR